MSTPCSKCRAVYRVQRSLEHQQNVRNLCKCEVARTCAYQKKGKTACGPVRQALLDADGAVELYLCETHCAQEALDELAPPQPKKTAAPKVVHDLLTEEGFRAEAKAMNVWGRCLRCYEKFALADAPLVVHHQHDDGRALRQPACPKCQGQSYAFCPP